MDSFNGYNIGGLSYSGSGSSGSGSGSGVASGKSGASGTGAPPDLLNLKNASETKQDAVFYNMNTIFSIDKDKILDKPLIKDDKPYSKNIDEVNWGGISATYGKYVSSVFIGFTATCVLHYVLKVCHTQYAVDLYNALCVLDNRVKMEKKDVESLDYSSGMETGTTLFHDVYYNDAADSFLNKFIGKRFWAISKYACGSKIDIMPVKKFVPTIGEYKFVEFEYLYSWFKDIPKGNQEGDYISRTQTHWYFFILIYKIILLILRYSIKTMIQLSYFTKFSPDQTKKWNPLAELFVFVLSFIFIQLIGAGLFITFGLIVFISVIFVCFKFGTPVISSIRENGDIVLNTNWKEAFFGNLFFSSPIMMFIIFLSVITGALPFITGGISSLLLLYYLVFSGGKLYDGDSKPPINYGVGKYIAQSFFYKKMTLFLSLVASLYLVFVLYETNEKITGVFALAVVFVLCLPFLKYDNKFVGIKSPTEPLPEHPANKINPEVRQKPLPTPTELDVPIKSTNKIKPTSEPILNDITPQQSFINSSGTTAKPKGTTPLVVGNPMPIPSELNTISQTDNLKPQPTTLPNTPNSLNEYTGPDNALDDASRRFAENKQNEQKQAATTGGAPPNRNPRARNITYTRRRAVAQ